MRNVAGRQILASLIVGTGALLLGPSSFAQSVADGADAPAAAVEAAAEVLGGHVKAFRDFPWYEPLRAEPHEGKVQLLIPAWAKEFPHSVEPGTRFSWQITLGREIPIVAVTPQIADANGRMDPKTWGIGLWTPVHFLVIMAEHAKGSTAKRRAGNAVEAYLIHRGW